MREKKKNSTENITQFWHLCFIMDIKMIFSRVFPTACNMHDIGVTPVRPSIRIPKNFLSLELRLYLKS